MLTPNKDELFAAFLERVKADSTSVSAHPDSKKLESAAFAVFDYSQKHSAALTFAVQNLSGAEILGVGTWNGTPFTLADLGAIVDSFKAFGLAGRVPLKLGHNEDQDITDGQPALGWVKNIYVSGNKLMADFVDMPQVVFDAIRSGLYKFISVELLRDVSAFGRVVPWLLDAVALLGADIPAVGTLKDLQSLTLARGPGLLGTERRAFAREKPTGVRSNMADEKTAEQRLADAEALVLTLRASESAARLEAETFKRRNEETAAATHKEKVEGHRKAVRERFERAVKDREILPAVRERFFKRFGMETDDILKIPQEDVEEYIKENPSPHKTTALAARTSSDEVVPGQLPDTELRVRTHQYCRANGLKTTNWEDLVKGAMVTLRQQPELARRWQLLPDDVEDGRVGAE